MAEFLARSLIKLIVTVAILGAVYIFAIKPVLDTTNDTIENAFGPIDGIQQQIQDTFDQAGDSGFDIQDLDLGDKSQDAQKLLKCIKRVQPDTTKMSACAERFQ